MSNQQLVQRYIVLSNRLSWINRIEYIMNEDFVNRSYQWCRVSNATKRKLRILDKLINK